MVEKGLCKKSETYFKVLLLNYLCSSTQNNYIRYLTSHVEIVHVYGLCRMEVDVVSIWPLPYVDLVPV